MLAGQDLDQHPRNQELLIVLRVEPDTGPAQLMCTFAGLVGYPGLNDAGVTAFQNALATPVWRASGMPHYLLKRVLLEQPNLAGCLDVARRAAGLLVGQLRANRWREDDRRGTDPRRDGDHRTGRPPGPHQSLSGRHVDRVQHCCQIWSACRAPRILALLRSRHGQITVDTLKQALADHDSYPTSICRHQDQMETIRDDDC